MVEYGRKKGVVKSVEKTSNNSMPKREKSNPLNMKNMLTSNILRSHTYGVKYQLCPLFVQSMVIIMIKQLKKKKL